jgi:hypothetical protein
MGNDDLVGDRLLAFAGSGAVVAARTGLRRSARSRECADRGCDHDDAEVCSNAAGEFGSGVEHQGTLDRLAGGSYPGTGLLWRRSSQSQTATYPQGVAGTSLPMNMIGPLGISVGEPPSGSRLTESVAFTRSAGVARVRQAQVVGSDWETTPNELGAADPP